MQVASPYIMIDFEGGETVYRLAHSTFRSATGPSAAARSASWSIARA